MFTPHSVVFGTGGYSGDVNVVYEVHMSPEDEDTPDGSNTRELFTIRYTNVDKLMHDLSFYYDPPPKGTITFKHQKHLTWTKESKENKESKGSKESKGG